MKKIRIFLLFCMFIALYFIAIGNSVTYLNSCGKTSGWTNGETYILNFTSTDFTNSDYYGGADVDSNGYYCFRFDNVKSDISFITDTNINNITMNFISTPLTNEQVAFLGSIDGYTFTNIRFYNTTFIKDAGDFVFSTRNSKFGLIGNSFGGTVTVKNITILGFDYFRRSEETFAIASSYINDSIIVLNDDFISRDVSASDTTRIYDSFIHADSLHTYLNGKFIINRSVISLVSDNLTSSYNTNSIIENSMLRNIIGVDSNDDGVFDTTPVPSGKPATYFQDLRVEDNLFGYQFIQDFNEGDVFVSGSENVVTINSDIIGGVNVHQTQAYEIFSPELVTLLYNNFNGIILTSNSALKSFFNQISYMQDNLLSYFNSTDDYKSLISISGNNILISDIYFTKYSNNNNAQIISDLLGVTRNNITIQDNTFYKSDDNFKYLNNYIIKLKANNLNINNNNFSVYTNFSNGYEILDIEGTNPLTNKVSYNYFLSNISIGTDTIIFSNNSDTKFYHNYIGTSVNITDELTYTGLNVTPLIAYNHTDSKIYYFYLGNYYEDNTGCVDSDSDGFCDSSFTSGTITDTHPLSSYPFDFASHILTADVVVDSTDFNITLTGLTDNETFIVVDTNSILSFGFIHNSSFPDLHCDYLIDGSIVDNIDNPINNTNYTINLNGWTEKEYVYRVECYNDLVYETSLEYNFYIEFGTTPSGNETETGSEIDITDIFTGDTDIFSTSSTSDSTDNLVSLIGLAQTPLIYLLILGFLFLIIVIVIFIFSMIKLGVGGIK